jgi:hypothetical protein
VGIGAVDANCSYLVSSIKPERELEDGFGAVLLPRDAQRASERGAKVGTTEKETADEAPKGTTAAKTAPMKRNMVIIGVR